MKPTTLLGAMILAATFAGPANAIYKCTTAKGVVYQDRPCREGNETDVMIVIPTGEIAPKNQIAQDSELQSNPGRGEGRFGGAKGGRTPSDVAVSVGKPADRQATDAAARGRTNDATARTSNAAQAKDAARAADNSGAPSTAEQARNAEPSAKYYTTDGFSAGSDTTPAHMTCESASGEKRIFYLSNGKLTSI